MFLIMDITFVTNSLRVKPSKFDGFNCVFFRYNEFSKFVYNIIASLSDSVTFGKYSDSLTEGRSKGAGC